jgi:hypothetical protein
MISAHPVWSAIIGVVNVVIIYALVACAGQTPPTPALRWSS